MALTMQLPYSATTWSTTSESPPMLQAMSLSTVMSESASDDNSTWCVGIDFPDGWGTQLSSLDGAVLALCETSTGLKYLSLSSSEELLSAPPRRRLVTLLSVFMFLQFNYKLVESF